jgi:hypothetical protein
VADAVRVEESVTMQLGPHGGDVESRAFIDVRGRGLA